MDGRALVKRGSVKRLRTINILAVVDSSLNDFISEK